MAVHTAAHHSSGQVLPFRESLTGDARHFVRHDAGRARSDRGRHRAAHHRLRTEGLRALRVGRHVVSADLGDHRADFRPPRRLLRAQAVRDRVDRRVHRGVGAVRRGQQHAVPRACARLAGHRRRDAGRHRVRLHSRSVPRLGRASALAGADEFGVRDCERGGAVARRLSHAVLRLALGVLCESAGRPAVAVFRLALPAASAACRARRQDAARLARCAADRGGARLAAVVRRVAAEAWRDA